MRMVAPEDCPSQAAYIAYFATAIAVMQTEEALERTAFELGVDSAADNIDYLEVRWAPRLHMQRGLSVDRVMRAVLAGLEAAPLQAVAIVCGMRQHSVEENLELARVAGAFAGRGVVGFDLAGDEVRYPAARQRPAFEAARAAALRLTCHAGEAGDPANVEEALDLGVERIAHGVIGAREPRIVERIRREGVVLDLCPTANWKCNAVPPLGIEGVGVTDKGVEHDGVISYGAVGVGDTKMKIHKAAIARLFERNDQVFDAEQVYALGEGL